MKKFALIAILLICSFSILNAAVISTPAATVRLTRTTVITTAQLDEAYKPYEEAGYSSQISKSDLLNSMVENELVLQGAEKAGYSLSAAQLDTLYSNYKTLLEQNNGFAISDEDYNAQVIAEYGTIDAFKKELGNNQIVSEYVQTEKADMLKNIPEPTEREIKNAYRQNQTTLFTQPVMYHLYMIAGTKSGNASEDQAKKAKFDGIYSDIKNGRVTFEKAVQLYTEDESTKNNGGDFGWMSDNQYVRQSLGDDFVDYVMDMDIGDISPVLETPSAFFIVKAGLIQDAKVLTLTDPIAPDNTTTVREYIYGILYQQNAQLLFQQAYQSLVADLRKQASINIIYK